STPTRPQTPEQQPPTLVEFGSAENADGGYAGPSGGPINLDTAEQVVAVFHLTTQHADGGAARRRQVDACGPPAAISSLSQSPARGRGTIANLPAREVN